MRCIFNNTDRVVACGFLRRSRTPSCCTIPRVAASATLAPCGFRTGRFLFRREQERFTGETFFQFLQFLRQAAVRARRRVVVITDNAKYHHARLHKEWRDDHQKDFQLDYLLPYCPALNPIARGFRCRGNTV
ncbi:MAG: transposase [Terriglobia bacterium]